MNRRGRRDTEANKNVGFIYFGVIAIIAVIAFGMAYVLYSGRMAGQAKQINNTQKIASSSDKNMMNIIGNTESTSSSIGKTVNELSNSIDITKQENNESLTNKMAVNTSNLENKKETSKNAEKTEQSNTEKVNISENQNADEGEKTKDPTFIQPVEGEKLKDYSRDNLVYSATLDEWTTHLGIDYAAQKTDIVKASANGTIKSIKNDPRFGLTVVIEHENGFESIYSNLLTAEFISVGEQVEQGQTIATVGNTARFEIADNTHIHFEIKKDGENVDPNIYIK